MLGLKAEQFLPTGTKCGSVRFDAIIEYDSPLSQAHVMLFARYWVSPDYYQSAVAWAEPHGRGLSFPIYPATLSIGSDLHALTLSHDLFPQIDQSIPKPIGSQTAFTNMFGDYPISNVRFADRNAEATRIYIDDVGPVTASKSPGTENVGIQIVVKKGKPERDVKHLDMQASDGHIDSLQVFGEENRLIKKVEYEYEGNSNAIRLQREKINLPESPITLGLSGKGATVRKGDLIFEFKEVPGVYHKGGRTSTVEYQSIKIGLKTVSLPVRVEVRNDSDKKLLRSVHLMNFQKSDLTQAQAKQAAAQFAGFSPQEQSYRKLLNRYWQKATNEVIVTDVEILKKLRDHFQSALPEEDTVGRQLRRINELMEINRILGDTQELERCYGLYLSIFARNNLSEMTLVGGQCAIDTLMLWGRIREADVLLKRWLDAAQDIKDMNVIQSFAERELKKGNFWTTFQLVDRLTDSALISADRRFEFVVLKCLVLDGLQRLLRRTRVADDHIMTPQADWVANSITTNRLAEVFHKAVLNARSLQIEIKEFTKNQAALKRRLDVIAPE